MSYQRLRLNSALGMRGLVECRGISMCQVLCLSPATGDKWLVPISLDVVAFNRSEVFEAIG